MIQMFKEVPSRDVQTGELFEVDDWRDGKQAHDFDGHKEPVPS